MAEWDINTKHSAESFNNGNKYTIDDQMSIEALNNCIENSLYAINHIAVGVYTLKFNYSLGGYNTNENKNILNKYINSNKKPMLLLQDDENSNLYHVLKKATETSFEFINETYTNGRNKIVKLNYINGDIIRSQIGDDYLKTKFSDFTLSASNWSSNQQTIDLTTLAGDRTNIIVSNSNTGTDEEVLANSKAIAKANIYKITYDETTKILTLVCENTPTTDIKIQVGVQI